LLVFQIRGLIGPKGILPASRYLHVVEQSLGAWQRVWYAPTPLWFSGGPVMLSALCWAGMLAALLLVLNPWPRGMLVICFGCFLSFVGATQDFSGCQSNGMLLEAGFIAFFFDPPGFRPGANKPAQPQQKSPASSSEAESMWHRPSSAACKTGRARGFASHQMTSRISMHAANPRTDEHIALLRDFTKNTAVLRHAVTSVMYWPLAIAGYNLNQSNGVLWGRSL